MGTNTNQRTVKNLLQDIRAAIGGVRLRAAVGTVVILLAAFIAITYLSAAAIGNELDERLTAEAVAAADRIAADIAADTKPGTVPWRPSAALAWQAHGNGWAVYGSVAVDSSGVTQTLPDPELPQDAYQITIGQNHSNVSVSRTTHTKDGPVQVRVLATGPALMDVWSAVSSRAIPLITLGTVMLVWWVVSRALGPVERMRVAASRVGVSEDISTRLPIGTGSDEIAALARTLNEMLDRIEAASDRQRAFISDAGHELRSPLTTMRTLLGTPGPIDVESRALLESACERLDLLVEDLFTLARLDEWGLGRIDDVDVDVLCDDAAAALNIQHPHLEVTVDAEPTRIRGDAAALSRVLTNLCSNAARHTTSRIDIRCTQEDNQVRISVADDGAGVPPHLQERIFERFARLEESRSRDAGGAGLGLAIVTQIVEAHNGTITVSDRQGGGAEFIVTLPTNGPKQH